jgi:hypothetical protein
MITLQKGSQESIAWLWKQIAPGDFITFNISADSCMKILNSENENISILRFGYEQNRLIFDSDDDSKIYVIAVIKDFSNLPSGMYKYEILVESLVDELKIEDSGELEIISE